MSLQSILKPNNYSLFVNNASLTGFDSAASLLSAVGNGQLSNISIIGGVITSPLLLMKIKNFIKTA